MSEIAPLVIRLVIVIRVSTQFNIERMKRND